MLPIGAEWKGASSRWSATQMGMTLGNWNYGSESKMKSAVSLPISQPEFNFSNNILILKLAYVLGSFSNAYEMNVHLHPV